MTLTLFPLIFFGVMLNAGANLLLKAGMGRIGGFDFSFTNIIPIGLQVAGNPFILLGLFAYVVSVVVWLLVLSRVDVSLAYPMLSLGFLVNAVAANYLLGEHVSFARLTGILIILAGIYIVARS